MGGSPFYEFYSQNSVFLIDCFPLRRFCSPLIQGLSCVIVFQMTLRFVYATPALMISDQKAMVMLMFQVMDNDRDMKVSIEELKTVLSNSIQGRNKMNSTLFRNLVEKSEKVEKVLRSKFQACKFSAFSQILFQREIC